MDAMNGILKVPVEAAGLLLDTWRVDMATRRTMRAAVVGTMAVLAAFSLSGCGSNPAEDASQNAVNNGAEKAAEKALENVASDGSNGDVSVNIGSDVAVPDSFPSDFPLPEGTLVGATTVYGGTVLMYEIDDPAVAEGIAAHFASDPAFVQTMYSDVDESQAWNYVGDEYTVMIGVFPDGETSQMTYEALPNTN